MTVPSPTHVDNVVTEAEWFYIEQVVSRFGDSREELRAKLILYLSYFAGLTVGELVEIKQGDVHCSHGDLDLPVWTVDIRTRPADRSTLYLLPPLQSLMAQYCARLHTDAFSVHRVDVSLWIKLRHRATRHHEYVEHVDGNTLYRIARKAMVAASQLADDAHDRYSANRLRSATISWLAHALEAHLYHAGVLGNWPWLLLGSRWGISPIGLRHLSPRKTLRAADVIAAFTEIGTILQWSGAQSVESRHSGFSG